jgi:hypothetical protein
MGIQDRDYMRERGRREKPFAPPKQGPSLLTMMLSWVAIALLVYRGYQWLDLRNLRHAKPVPTTAAPTTMQSPERPAPPRSEPPTAAPAQAIAATRVARESAALPVAAPAPQEVNAGQPPATGGTIYLCKSYAGASFWSQAPCGQHGALIDSIVPVPQGLPFEQQVRLAEQRRQPVAVTVTHTQVQVNSEPAPLPNAECKALDARVEQLDAMARQPQSGQMQDWIRGEREAARSRQFALRC